MQLDGRRQSSNVEDRRGSTVVKAGGLGLGGLIIVGLISFLLGGDPISTMQTASEVLGGQQTEYVSDRQQTPEEEELAVFASQILAGTEDVWTKIFSHRWNRLETARRCPVRQRR